MAGAAEPVQRGAEVRLQGGVPEGGGLIEGQRRATGPENGIRAGLRTEGAISPIFNKPRKQFKRAREIAQR